MIVIGYDGAYMPAIVTPSNSPLHKGEKPRCEGEKLTTVDETLLRSARAGEGALVAGVERGPVPVVLARYSHEVVRPRVAERQVVSFDHGAG